jgi:hypothetical protein
MNRYRMGAPWLEAPVNTERQHDVREASADPLFVHVVVGMQRANAGKTRIKFVTAD